MRWTIACTWFFSRVRWRSLGDRACLVRVGHRHPRDVRFDQPDDRVRVARRFDRDLILSGQAVAKHAQRVGGQADLSGLTDPAGLPSSANL